MIRIEGLKKTFDDLIFQDVNIEINKGDALVIIGGSGCGKSTLLRCINRHETPDSGHIYFDGEDILAENANIDKLRQRMGMVYQSFNLFSHLNVIENVMLAPMKIKGVSEKEAAKKAVELLTLVGMENRMFHMPSMLSGGQKQRVAIARCLAMDPEVILFDEPTSALDPTMVDEVESVIKKLINDGMTSVIVTHEMDFAKNVATKVAFLAEHGVYEMGTAKEIFDNPKRELTRRFLYRARLFEKGIDKKTTDYKALASETKQFLSGYGMTKKQADLIHHIFDEVLYPLTNDGRMEIALRVVADNVGEDHSVLIEVKNAEEDPLTLPCIDALGLKIVSGLCKKADSYMANDGNAWELQFII